MNRIASVFIQRWVTIWDWMRMNFVTQQFFISNQYYIKTQNDNTYSTKKLIDIFKKRIERLKMVKG